MKELRFNAEGGVWRVAFAFDPKRQAVLLIAGKKSGVHQKRFYRNLIKLADKRFKKLFKQSLKGKNMTTSLDDIVNSLPPERKAKIDSLTEELFEEVATLRETKEKNKILLREVLQPRYLGIKQENVSRLERRNNIHLSTLKDYIHALGGKLHLIVEFPNQEPIEIKDCEDIEEKRFKKPNSYQINPEARNLFIWFYSNPA